MSLTSCLRAKASDYDDYYPELEMTKTPEFRTVFLEFDDGEDFYTCVSVNCYFSVDYEGDEIIEKLEIEPFEFGGVNFTTIECILAQYFIFPEYNPSYGQYDQIKASEMRLKEVNGCLTQQEMDVVVDFFVCVLFDNN